MNPYKKGGGRYLTGRNVSALVASIVALAVLANLNSISTELPQLLPHPQQSKTSEKARSLPTNVNHKNMVALRKVMKDGETSNPRWNAEAAHVMLKFLVEQAPEMFPLLDTVPVSADETKISSLKFVGQELEDKEIYSRFYNEHTRKCHSFHEEGGLFESGAFTGVTWSNTFFFERHFGMQSILVEASATNFEKLEKAVAEQRPHAKAHRAAMCPIGDSFVCLDAEGDSAMHNAARSTGSQCPDGKQEAPCFPFDDSIYYAFVSLDIEGFEWEFLKLRDLKADIVLVEVIQWLRKSERLLTVIEFVSRMAELGYFLYASKNMVGVRNFLFVSQSLVEDCFHEFIIPVESSNEEQVI